MLLRFQTDVTNLGVTGYVPNPPSNLLSSLRADCDTFNQTCDGIEYIIVNHFYNNDSTNGAKLGQQSKAIATLQRDLLKVQGLLPTTEVNTEDVEMEIQNSKPSKAKVQPVPIDLSGDTDEEGDGRSLNPTKVGNVPIKKDLKTGRDVASSIVIDGTPPPLDSTPNLLADVPDLDALLASINVDAASLPSNPNSATSTAGLSDEIKALFASLPPLNDINALSGTHPQPSFDLSLLSGSAHSAQPTNLNTVAATSFTPFDFSSLNPMSVTPNENENFSNAGEEFDLDKLLASFE